MSVVSMIMRPWCWSSVKVVVGGEDCSDALLPGAAHLLADNVVAVLAPAESKLAEDHWTTSSSRSVPVAASQCVCYVSIQVQVVNPDTSLNPDSDVI
eukprot:1407757-Rhodomonas_salina.1